MSKKSGFSGLSNLIPFLKPYKREIFFALLSLLITTIMVLLFGKIIKYIIDFGFAQNNIFFLRVGILVFILSVITMALAGYFRSSLINQVAEKVVASLRKKTYNHIIKVSPQFFEINKAGDVVSRLTVDSVVLYEMLSSTISFFIRNSLLFLGCVFFLFFTSFKLTLVSILAIFLAISPIIFLGKKIKNLSKISQENLSLVGSHIEETVNGVKTIQAFLCEEKEVKNFDKLVDGALAAAIKKIRLKAFLVALVIAFAFGSISVMLYVGGGMVLNGEMTSGELSSFVFYAIIIATSLVSLSQISGQLQNASAAAARIFEILDISSKVKEIKNPLKIKDNKNLKIEFKNVDFAYESHKNHKILQDFNLEINAKEKLAIVGMSGSGKSTILEIMLRFYDASSGEILLNGQNIKNLSLADLRENFAYISQDPFIFSGTIFDNIAYGSNKISKKNVQKIIDENKALNFINKMPQGLDTFVGEKGIKLSGGERQRIAIARAIVKDAQVILLDEATSALDNKNEKEVVKEINKLAKDKITITIAHNLSSIKDVQRIIVLQDGKIIEEGSHQALIKKDGFYKGLYNTKTYL